MFTSIYTLKGIQRYTKLNHNIISA